MESSPPFVLRSVSLNDVTTTETINTQPQNYAVVGGQTYRIRRSHEEKSFTGIASPRLLEADSMTESLTISSLLAQLKQSEETIQQQKLQIDYQSDRMRQLETLLRQLNVEESVIQRPFLFDHHLHANEINAPAPPFSVSTISPVITQGKTLLTLSREKSATSDETDICADTPVSTFQSIDSLTPKAYPGTVPESKEESVHTGRYKQSSQIFFPDSLNNTFNSNASFNDNDSVITRNTVITVKDNDDLGLLDDDISACKDSSFAATIPLPVTTTASPDRGSLLQQRLSMSTTERRKVLSTVCSSRSKLAGKAKSHRVLTKKAIVTPSTVITPSDEEKSNQSNYLHEEENPSSSYYNHRQDNGLTSGDMDKSSLSILSHASFMSSANNIPSATTRCFWKTKQQQNPQDIYLFIAYDNPQMHKSIEQILNTSSSSSSANHQMHVMIETHESKEKAKILFGEICFSGFFNELEGFMIDSCQHLNQLYNNNQNNNHESLLRGSNVLVVHELIGVSGDLKQFQRRNKNDHPDIIELLFINKQKEALPSSSSSIQYYPIRRDEDVIHFFQGCNGRVDVILDPYHDNRSWYPYYEGSRKMAPQFRSKGIGYLRLGDDMSNYGTAFLSLDAGKTFLDNGATNIVNVNHNSSMSSMNSLMLTRTRGLSSDNMSETSSIATAATSSSTVKRKGAGKKGLTTTIRKLVNSSRENSVCQSSEDDETSSILTKNSKI